MKAKLKMMKICMLIVPLIFIGGCSRSNSNGVKPEPDILTLTISASPPDKGTVSCFPVKQKYSYGDTIVVSATAVDGYSFSNWTGDTVAPENNFKVIMKKNMTLVANLVNDSIGIVWTNQNQNGSLDLRSVTWTGSQLVAVGDSGTVLTSPDGKTWISQSLNTSNSLNCVIWAHDQLVAVGDSGKIVTSPDGITWTSRISGHSHALYSVVWSGKKFVAVGGYYNYYKTVYMGTVGEDLTCIVTSLDGATWTPQVPQASGGLSGKWSSIAWNGQCFVSAGYKRNTSELGGGGQLIILDRCEVYSSTDAINWTDRTIEQSNTIIYNAIAWSGSAFLITGGSIASSVYQTTPYAVSYNGTSWFTLTSSGRRCFNGVTCIGPKFIEVGNDGEIVEIIGNSDINFVTSGTSANLYGIVWTGEKLVAVGASGTVLTSP